VRLYGHAYQLERKLHGGREAGGKRNGERERDNSQYQEDITVAMLVHLCITWLLVSTIKLHHLGKRGSESIK